jgi:putative ABC transport system permease protein
MQTLLYAVRQFRTRPGFTAAVVVTLALGIGANTALFSVVKAVLLEPLPYRDPGSIAMIWSQWRDFEKTWVSIPEYHEYRERLHSFDDVALFQTFEVNITEGDAERVTASAVTPNLLRVLGVSPVLGRDFVDDEGTAGRDEVAIVSYGLWQGRYAGDAGVIGETIAVNGVARTVVGVLPQGFRLPLDFATASPTQILTPSALPPSTGSIPHGGGSHSYHAIGRLAAGVTAATANRELAAHVQGLSAEGVYAGDMRFRAFAVTATDEVAGRLRPALLVLMGAVVLVLLIACANVMNLLLVRGEERRREMGVRAALGAGHGRLLRQFLMESLVLVVIGAAFGVWLAWLGLRGLIAVAPPNLPRLSDTSIDVNVLGFAALVAAVTALLAGVLPAVQGARVDLHASLKEGSRTGSATRASQLTRRAIVVAEVALAVVLVAGAGLTLRSLWNLVRIDPGFDAASVLTMRLSANSAFYPDDAAVTGFYGELLGRVRVLPGVEQAGIVRLLPIDTEMGDTCVHVEGYSPPPGQCAASDWQAASPGYFEAMGIPVVEGRAFTDGDDREAPLAIIVNEEFVRRYVPEGNALGTRLRLAVHEDAEWQTIVGVVGDVRHNGITGEIKGVFYRPHAQWAVPRGSPQRSMTLVIRSRGDARALMAPVRAQARALDPRIPVSRVQTMQEVLGGAVAQPRFTVQLLAGFAGLALLLALIGVYSVVAYAVATRRRELGIRLALGAEQRDVVWLSLRQGAVYALLGAAAGMGAALFGSRLLAGLLYDVSATDPATYAGVIALATAAVLLASWLPARRAARIDPMEAMRHE